MSFSSRGTICTVAFILVATESEFFDNSNTKIVRVFLRNQYIAINRHFYIVRLLLLLTNWICSKVCAS